ncbi:cytochrome c [Deltaproteobacteria bacterium TL4]
MRYVFFSLMNFIFSRQFIVVLGITATLFTRVTPVYAYGEAQARHLGQYRKLFMEAKGIHFLAIRMLVKRELGMNEHLITHAEILNQMAEEILSLFPKGSLDAQDRTSAKIWNQEGALVAEFIAQAEVLKQETRKLVKLAKTGDLNAIDEQIRIVDDKGCRGCHALYREQ